MGSPNLMETLFPCVEAVPVSEKHNYIRIRII